MGPGMRMVFQGHPDFRVAMVSVARVNGIGGHGNVAKVLGAPQAHAK